MSTKEIAEGLVALCREEKSSEAVRTYYSPDIVTYEAMPDAQPMRGIEAVLETVGWWEANMETHHGEVVGPFINGDQFAVRFTYDVTDKTSGKRYPLDEIAVYEVKDGKIAEARFLYGPVMMSGA